MTSWNLDSIHWQAFDKELVDPDLLALAKAAALVEFNGADYTEYLCRVFHDDPRFQRAARNWGEEEVRHGEALGRWAAMADPQFDFSRAVEKFRAGYRIPAADESVRGSRSGELLARCIVETGTSSYYAALHDHCEEPVLRQICHLIRHDELRHYRLFHHHLKKYRELEPLSPLQRLRVGIGRIAEADDDELSYAFHCGNELPEPYERAYASREYLRRALHLYRRNHVDEAVKMSWQAMDLPLRQVFQAPLASVMSWRLQRVGRQASQ